MEMTATCCSIQDDLPGDVQMMSRQMGHRYLVPNVSKQLVLDEELRPKKLTWVSLQPGLPA